MKEIELKGCKKKTDKSSVFTEKEEKFIRIVQNIEEQKTIIEDLENRYFISKDQRYRNYLRQMYVIFLFVKKIFSFIICREGNINKIKEFIFCGPTIQAVIIPYENLHLLNSAERQVEKVHKELAGAMEHFTKNKVKTNFFFIHCYLRIIFSSENFGKKSVVEIQKTSLGIFPDQATRTSKIDRKY